MLPRLIGVQAFAEDQDVGGDLGTSFHSPGLLA